jgi:hypothetical protein
MKFTTLIPMRYNNGKEVPVDLLDSLIDQLAEQFQGCSEEGVTKGQWLDQKVARLYRDESRRVTVVCDNPSIARFSECAQRYAIHRRRRHDGGRQAANSMQLITNAA